MLDPAQPFQVLQPKCVMVQQIQLTFKFSEMTKGKSNTLNYLGNYTDYPKHLKWRFFMPGSGVFINTGFLGEAL